MNGLQHTVDLFVASCMAFGLKTSLTKINVMFIIEYIKLIITVRGTILNIAETFTYMGNALNIDGVFECLHSLTNSKGIFS